jgi:hypothetical protein
MKKTLEGPVEKIEVGDLYRSAQMVATNVIRNKNKLLGSAGKADLYK